MVRQSLILLVFLTLPFQARAQTLCGPQDYDSPVAPNFDCPGPDEYTMTPNLHPPPSVPVKLGETTVALWDGALVHRDRLVQLGLKLKAARRLRWADRVHLIERYHLELEHVRESGRIREEFLEEQAEAQSRRAVLAERRANTAQAWYRSFGFGLVIGFIASGLLVALAVYLGISL